MLLLDVITWFLLHCCTCCVCLCRWLLFALSVDLVVLFWCSWWGCLVGYISFVG